MLQFVNPYSQILTFVQYMAAIHLRLLGARGRRQLAGNLCLLTDSASRVWHAAQYDFRAAALMLPPPGWTVRQKFPD